MPDERDLRSAPRYLWWLLASQSGRSIRAALLGTLWLVGLTLPPYVLSLAVDDGLRTGRFDALLKWVLVLLALGLANAYVSITRHRTLTKVRMDGAFRTVHAVIEQTTRLGGSLTGKITAGELATVGISDVWVISSSLTVVGPGVGAVIAYLVVAVLLLAISPVLAAVVLVGAPAVAVLVGPLLGRLRRIGSGYRERQGALTASLVDIVEGLRILNGIGGKQLFADRYRRDSESLRDQGFRVGAVSSWVPTLGVGLPLLFLAAVTWLAARMAAEHTISVGDLVAVYGYVMVLVVPVAELIESGAALAQSFVSARRVIALLRTEPDELARSGTADGPDGPAELCDPVSGVDVRPGVLTVLASERPSDAQAVIDRLGAFAPSAATWGGVDINTIARSHIRDRIMVADNEAAIFAGTLHGVVAGRGEADADAVLHALWVAAAAEIAGSDIESRGRNLSGGQRQRLRLARAVLAEPEVLLAAEPTSAVDAHTEALIAARLTKARAGRTTMVTSTSPLLLDRADVVHYLAGGTVVASGTHEELLAREPGYRQLVSRSLDAL